MDKATFQVGDWVIYRKTKFSSLPGPRARNVAASESGEGYAYNVDKYWIVTDVLPDGAVQVMTRRGKQLQFASLDPNLRRASWWQRLRCRRRFEEVAQSINQLRADGQLLGPT